MTKLFKGLSLTLLGLLCAASVGATANKKPEYVCHRAAGAINIDGKLDEADWQKAALPKFYTPQALKTPLSKTEAKVLWDDEYLYVSFRAYDTDVWSVHTERDAQTCEEDCLEAFIKPDPSKTNYYNFEVDAQGTIYDAYNMNRNAGGYTHHRFGAWNCEGFKAAVTVNGTINDPSDKDKFWQMEMAIPYADLPSMKGKTPKPGDVWKFHLARYDFSVYLPIGDELSSCAPLSKVDFHDASEWINLKFAK
jgi:hypothetical protein